MAAVPRLSAFCPHAVVALFLLLAFPALAQSPAAPPRLSLPVDCLATDDCFIQWYMDIDAGPGREDPFCGILTYDGHRGIDFRLRDRKAMRRGFSVLAALDGVVAATRDGIDDPPRVDRKAIAGRECGNGVLLQHRGGYLTQYCHMRKGSIAVKRGQRVRAGDRLGLIGQSGLADFTHLHFELRHGRKIIDPFTGQVAQTPPRCQPLAGKGLWADETAPFLVYRPVGLVRDGFSAVIPDREIMDEGRDRLPSVTSPALLYWLRLYGVRKGDRVNLTLWAPGGRIMAESRNIAPRDMAQVHYYLGRKLRTKRWPPGRYRARTELLRQGEILFERSTEYRLQDKPVPNGR